MEQVVPDSEQTPQSPVDTDFVEWRTAVGRVIIAFGELELITYKCLAHLPSDRITEAASRLDFSRRINLIDEILAGRDAEGQSAENFSGMLKQAKGLAKKRNAIAHNPVTLNVYIHRTTGDRVLERAINVARNGDSIDLFEVKEFAEQCENLAVRMWIELGKILA